MKNGFLGLFGKNQLKLIFEAISETTGHKANQQAVRGFQNRINDLNEPVKTVSEATVDLGHVVEAIKRLRKKAKVFLMKSRLKS